MNVCFITVNYCSFHRAQTRLMKIGFVNIIILEKRKDISGQDFLHRREIKRSESEQARDEILAKPHRGKSPGQHLLEIMMGNNAFPLLFERTSHPPIQLMHPTSFDPDSSVNEC